MNWFMWYAKLHGKCCQIRNIKLSLCCVCMGICFKYSRNYMKFLEIRCPGWCYHCNSSYYLKMLYVPDIIRFSCHLHCNELYQIFMAIFKPFIIYRQLLFHSDDFVKVFLQKCFIFKEIHEWTLTSTVGYRFLITFRASSWSG